MPVSTFPSLSWKNWVGGRLDKRIKFILNSGILTLFFYLGNLLPVSLWQTAFFLGISFYFLAFLSLFLEVKSFKFLLICLLPALFSAFFFCFIRLSSLPFGLKVISPLFFGLGIYSLFLVVNIFNISLERMIPLFRAAWAVEFLFAILSAFFAYSFLLSLRLSFWQNGLFFFLLSFPLIFSSLWTLEPKQKIKGKFLLFCLVLSLLIGELALALSFWPAPIFLFALFEASCFYALVGIGQLYFAKSLTKKRIKEYLSLTFLAFLFLILKTKWG